MANCKIYHNPRCSKSRHALALLQSLELAPEVHRYLDVPLSVSDLKDLAKRLKCRAVDMMRAKDKRYDALGLNRDMMSEAQCFAAMAKYPELMERPIVVLGRKAVIARPPERVHDLL
jgi:arsenate reductase (glutaredoxin)